MRTPFELTATLLAGLGLFFVGIKLLSGNLKNVSSHRFRLLLSKLGGTALGAGLWGLLSGLVTQSGRTTSYIVASLVSGGLLSVRQALPVVLWSNAGCSLVVFAAVVPIEYLILLFVGLSGLLLAFEFPDHYRNAYGAIFGLALLLYGLTLVKTGASGFIEYPWFESLLVILGNMGLLAFILGVLLTLIAQSHLGVILVALAISGSGLFSLEQVVMIIYGAQTGSSLITHLLGVHFRGTSGQVVAAQVGYNLLGVALFMGLFYLEGLGDVPLVMALAQSISTEIGEQGAFVTILFNVVTSALLSVLIVPYQRIIERLQPPSPAEDLAAPAFIHDTAVDQPETAALLIEKEQQRLLQRLPAYFHPLRGDPGHDTTLTPKAYHRAFAIVSERIRAFTLEVLHLDVPLETSDVLLTIQNRQELLETIEEDVFSLVGTLQEWTKDSRSGKLGLNIAEGLDAILLTLIAAEETREPDELTLLAGLTADRGEGMEKIRKSYLTAEESLTPEERSMVLYLTHLFERVTWSIGRYGRLLAQTGSGVRR